MAHYTVPHFLCDYKKTLISSPVYQSPIKIFEQYSEYNDSTYDNELQYVIVHDKDGNELPPIKKTAKECREGWADLRIPNTSIGHYGDNESEDPMEDVVIQLTDELPEFYVKVN